MRRARALCTREEAKRLLPNYREPQDVDEKAAADALWDDLIDAASQRIYEVSGREFLAYNDPGQPAEEDPLFPAPPAAARDFDVSLFSSTPADPATSGRRGRRLKVGDLAVLTALSYGTPFVAARYDLDPAAYVRELPTPRAPWQPIRYLEVYGYVWAGQVYTVTGVWGFPQVPADVRRAAQLQAAIWATADTQNFSKTFLQAAAAGASPREPRALSQEAFDVAFSYLVPEVG